MPPREVDRPGEAGTASEGDTHANEGDARDRDAEPPSPAVDDPGPNRGQDCHDEQRRCRKVGLRAEPDAKPDRRLGLVVRAQVRRVAGDQSVRLRVDCGKVLRPRRLLQAEHAVQFGVEPVGQELDAMLCAWREVGRVRGSDILGRRGRNVVTVHEQWHRRRPAQASRSSAADSCGTCSRLCP